jgi:hypothetical protein
VERARIWQIALAAILASTLLLEVAALYDPDIGTPVPLFHRWTCHGALTVEAAGLRLGTSGLNVSASWSGEAVPSYFLAYVQRGEAPREELPAVRDDRGWHIFFVTGITPETHAFGIARDLSGRHCDGQSPTLRATSPSPAATSPP